MVDANAGENRLPCRLAGEWQGDSFRITVEGDLDLTSFLVFEEYLRAYGDRPLRIDLSGVVFIDSSGLAALMLGKRRAEEADLPFAVGPVSDNVQRTMELSGVADQFELG